MITRENKLAFLKTWQPVFKTLADKQNYTWLFPAALSAHETGWGTSAACVDGKNLFGASIGGCPIRYETHAETLRWFAIHMHPDNFYFGAAVAYAPNDIALIELIKGHYCPEDREWARKVKERYSEIQLLTRETKQC